MAEKLGFSRRSDFGGIVSHFLLLRDQVTWKRRFKENKVRKQNHNFIFVILILEESPNLRTKDFIDFKPLLELFLVDSMVDFLIWDELEEVYGRKMGENGEICHFLGRTREWYRYQRVVPVPKSGTGTH